MKKYLLGLAVLLMGTAVMTSCSDDNDGPETYLQVYSTGAYVVNSGNMYSKIESSLTAIDYASSTATQNVFKTANGRTLGNTANDGIVYGNKIYLAVDQSNTIEVIDKKTKQSIKQIKTTELLGNAEGAHQLCGHAGQCRGCPSSPYHRWWWKCIFHYIRRLCSSRGHHKFCSSKEVAGG